MDTCIFDIKESAVKQLKEKDPTLGRLIEKAGRIRREIILDPFTALVQSIVFQQLAFAAANTIWRRLLSLAVEITPSIIYNLSEISLRECGLSGPKILYIKNISKTFLDKDISKDMLLNSSDKEIVDELEKIKGIGTWTAEMFLIFCLGHENVFSYKDLGLRKGVKWLYGLKNEPTEKFCSALTEIWEPYSTIASLYLWEITIQNYFKFSANDTLYGYLKAEKPARGYMLSPLGEIEIVTSNKGLEKLEFCDGAHKHEINSGSYLLNEVKKQLTEYFDGTRKVFDLPLSQYGTDFQHTVWSSLLSVPFGETRNYGEIASLVGVMNGSRAVGSANGKNRILIVTPSHRVIGANGNLTGYASGLRRKMWLLEHETKNH